MTPAEQRNSDKAITTKGDALRRSALRALLVAAIPGALIVLSLYFLREPMLRHSVTDTVGDVVVEQRAGDVTGIVEGLRMRLVTFAKKLPQTAAPGSLNPAQYGFAEAAHLRIIPLDDRGTVGLDPQQWGLRSNVAVDLIRLAYTQDTEHAEAILQDGTWYLVMAQRYTRGDTVTGVVLLSVPASLFEKSLSRESDLGQWSLVQQHAAGPAQTIAGAVLGTASDSFAAPVANTPWQVKFAPSDAFVDDLLPSRLLLLLALITALGATLAGVGLLIWEMPKIIKREVAQVLDNAANSRSIVLTIPQLSPIAVLLHQLNHLDRRKVRSPRHLRSQDKTKANPATAGKPQEKSFSAPPVATVEEINDSDSATDTDAELAPDEAPSKTSAIVPIGLLRQYGIRGEFGKALSDAVMKRLGFGLADLAKEKNIVTLVVARDARPGSQALHSDLTKALLGGGCDIIDLGTVPLPLWYYAMTTGDVNSGVAVTGAGAADAVNGIDIILSGNPIGKNDLLALHQRALVDHNSSGRGRLSENDISDEYIDRIAVDIGLGLPLKVVVDNNFSATSLIAPDVFAALGCEVISIDDAEPGRQTDQVWSLSARSKALAEHVLDQGADLGLLFNSEGEQLHTVTNRGTPVSAEQLLVLLARDILERNPGIDVLHDLRGGRSIREAVAKCGGRALPTAGSSPAMAQQIRETGALIGGGSDGDFYFNDRWYGSADGIYAAARLLEILGASPKSYDDLLEALPAGHHQASAELDCSDEQAEEILINMERHKNTAEARLLRRDGLRADFHDGWLAVVRRRTTPGLSFSVEADDADSLERLTSKIRAVVADVSADFTLSF